MLWSTASSLNRYGRVVGSYGDGGDGFRHAFTWKAGQVTLLRSPPGAGETGSSAHGVSDDGLISSASRPGGP
jgi:uncharacterized membrane protein